MGFKIFLSLVFILIVFFLLVLYWFVPLTTTEFKLSQDSYSFSDNLTNVALQFYPNMRFSDSRISYRIGDCPLNKKGNMEEAFSVVSQKTSLNFYPVLSGEEISVSCDSKIKVEGRFFIAGEGGPTNITQADSFNVINHGQILLLREVSCPLPAIEIHELLHVLGFDHINDTKSIMYPVANCQQDIDPLIIKQLGSLYSIPSEPDLAFENVSAVMRGKYLDTNISVRNYGLRSSLGSSILIYADNKLIKELNLEPLDVGHGRVIFLTNVWVAKINTNKINFSINYSFEELTKQNNIVELQVKK